MEKTMHQDKQKHAGKANGINAIAITAIIAFVIITVACIGGGVTLAIMLLDFGIVH